ncbi:hypothetical protein LSH36_161g09008 [Paralvinella palmiformis]|uniref:ABC transporter domain-containing protein n=1 Tax=Paralvinella palmiformis TaxID=53620 RepID=A0AAD9N856_9ANNE|nr:hypothetical protein LSH36_161g09008 [Paralvinella palmiformis]
MPSDAKKKQAQRKKDAAKKREQPKKKGANIENDEIQQNGIKNPNIDELAVELGDLDLAANHRAVTGVLLSHPDSRDVHIGTLSITFHGAELLVDTNLELNCGRRYGLIGLNGCGKSSLLSAIGNRELPIPEHVDIFHLKRELAPSEKTALEAVLEVDEEKHRLEMEAEVLAVKESDEAQDRLLDVYERLDELDSDLAEVRAAEILFGLGFSKDMQNKKVKNFSGGWRMRIALARALYVKPDMMLLDEPTNHLDLEACVWLEQYLRSYKRILVIVSHSQDFLNGVCTNILHMNKKKMRLFGGNYDTYIQTRFELEEHQMKKYKWEQDQIAHMKNYIARFGHGSAKLARQAKSKEKTLAKMVDGGLAEKVTSDKTMTFSFPECGTIPPPVLQVQNVSFRYRDDQPYIYKKLEFGMDLDSRIALVGPNGAGKSTLIKLISGEHLQEQLDLSMTALDWMMMRFPDIKERDDMRRIIGRYGLTGQQQTCPIKNLSDGQRCRIMFAWLAGQTPHMLLLDEPTNHLDIETIDALADAINGFDGGMLLVSHDFRLISQVAEEIWISNNQTITKWNGTIYQYKEKIMKDLRKETERRAKKK